MKQRLFWLFALLVAGALSLAACGGATPAPAAEEPAAAAPATAAPAATEAPAAQPTEEAMAEPTEEAMAAATEEAPAGEAMSLEIEPIKIAIVMPSTISDLAWSQSMYDSLLSIQADAGGEDVVEIAYTENMFNVTDAAAAIRDYAANGYNLVIAHGTQYGTSLFEIAPDFPEPVLPGAPPPIPVLSRHDNIFAYEAQAQEGGYVNGVLAATCQNLG